MKRWGYIWLHYSDGVVGVVARLARSLKCRGPLSPSSSNTCSFGARSAEILAGRPAEARAPLSMRLATLRCALGFGWTGSAVWCEILVTLRHSQSYSVDPTSGVRVPCRSLTHARVQQTGGGNITTRSCPFWPPGVVTGATCSLTTGHLGGAAVSDQRRFISHKSDTRTGACL